VYMCDCNCFIFCVKNLCVHCINVKGLKLTFGIRELLASGDAFVAKGLARSL
jgi:hypothetical protein